MKKSWQIVLVIVFSFGWFGNWVLAESEVNSLPLSSSNGSSFALSACKGVNSVPNKGKVVALTFDDGPHEIYTRQILKVLRQNEIKATFFMIGQNAKKFPEVVKMAYEDGNVVANHSLSHHHLNRLPGEEIETEMTKASKIVQDIIGVYPLLFRPPYGACSVGSVRVARNLNLKTIMWSAMVDDYHVDRTTSYKIAASILKLVKPGAIIGLHDGGGNREKTVEALQMIIRDLREQGYRFVTIPELLNIPAYGEENVYEA